MGIEGASRSAHEASSLRDYLHIVKRRKWIIVQAVVLAPLAAVVVSLLQDSLYRSSAEVLLTQQNLATSLTGTFDPTVNQDPQRMLQTQAQLAHVPAVAERVLRATKLKDRTPRDLLGQCDVTPQSNANLLTFACTDASPALAARLATSFAHQYTIYRRRLDTASLERARKEVQARIAELDRRHERGSALHTSLVEKEQQLSTLEALQTSNAFVVQAAGHAARVQPRPARNGVLGLALGLVLGVGLAFLREALDTRIRSTDEIERRLGIPLLARIPEPPRWLQRTSRLVMMVEPNSVQAEAFRVFRTNLDFFNLEHGARTIMVTSAVEQEGKSTTVANLAVALSRAGQRVVLVDLDLRRPFIDRFFDLEAGPGLTDVALGRARLAPVSTEEPEPGAAPPGEDLPGRARGSLEILTTGRLPTDTGEFVGSQELARILLELRERADVVLIDSPPLLVVGDAIALSAKVDAVIVLTRLNVVRGPMLNELRRVLDTTPAVKLGLVVTGANLEEEYRYGYGGYAYRTYGPRTERRAAR